MLEQINILLADDDLDDCVFFKQALGELTMQTELKTIHDGEKLMEYLTDNTTVLPDILFLDLNMHRKNGFECLTEIKGSKALNALPIVIFSTSFEQETVNQLYKNGAQFFIRKPSEFSQFKKTIQKLITLISEGKLPEPSMENFIYTIPNSLII